MTTLSYNTFTPNPYHTFLPGLTEDDISNEAKTLNSGQLLSKKAKGGSKEATPEGKTERNSEVESDDRHGDSFWDGKPGPDGYNSDRLMRQHRRYMTSRP